MSTAPELAETRFLERVTAHIRDALESVAADYEERGRSLRELGSAKEIAARMLATVPSPSRWDEALGPFYSTSKVAQILGSVSRQAIADRRKRRTLLGLRTADGVFVYPVFQFDDRNEVLDGWSDVLQAFDPNDVDDWTLAAWLAAKRKALDGLSVVEWLRSGRPKETVLSLARAQAARYAT